MVGADAVIGIDLDYSEISGGKRECSCWLHPALPSNSKAKPPDKPIRSGESRHPSHSLRVHLT